LRMASGLRSKMLSLRMTMSASFLDSDGNVLFRDRRGVLLRPGARLIIADKNGCLAIRVIEHRPIPHLRDLLFSPPLLLQGIYSIYGKNTAVLPSPMLNTSCVATKPGRLLEAPSTINSTRIAMRCPSARSSGPKSKDEA